MDSGSLLLYTTAADKVESYATVYCNGFKAFLRFRSIQNKSESTNKRRIKSTQILWFNTK